VTVGGRFAGLPPYLTMSIGPGQSKLDAVSTVDAKIVKLFTPWRSAVLGTVM